MGHPRDCLGREDGEDATSSAWSETVGSSWRFGACVARNEAGALAELREGASTHARRMGCAL